MFCNIAERSKRFSDIDEKKLITSLKLKVLHERANSLKIIIAFFFVNLNEILSTEIYVSQINRKKQPSIGVLRKRCFENIQQIYRRTPMPK